MLKLWTKMYCVLTATLLGLVSTAWSATLTVSPTGQGFFPTLQAAIDAAAVGDTVLALPGTFAGPGNRNLDFGGKDLSLIGRDGSAFTTIDCEYAGRGIFLQSGETLATRVTGLTVLHPGGDPELIGGGISCVDASITVTDLVVREATGYSCGGISVLRGSLHANGLVVEATHVTEGAGCLGFYWADSVIVQSAILEGGSVTVHGGAVDVWESSASFTQVTIRSGEADFWGGAMRCGNSTVLCEDCLFTENSARDGGAIALRGSNLTLRNSTFIANSAWRWGAALYYDELGEPSGGLVENCDFRGNNSQWGGIITLMNHADPTLRGLTIVGNTDGDGISAGCCYVQAHVENCLIAHNQGGYGIVDDPSGVSWLWLSCSNVFGNEFGEYYHASQTGISGNLSVDPQLCDPSFETLGLADSSPCLPENNTCGLLMGNHGAECTLTAVGAPAPPGVELAANYPNPFNPSTTIPFSLDAPTAATLTIHDVSGRLVRVLSDARSFPAGHLELRWDGLDAAGQPAPSGVYFYRLETPAGATARAMLLVK